MAFKDKDDIMKEFLNGIAKDVFGRTIEESLNNNICVQCGEDVGVFDDELSEREYNITGLCQKCQDDIYR